VVRHRLTRTTASPPIRSRRPFRSPVPNTRTNAALVLALLALTGGCGGTSARKPPRAATFGLASPNPASSDSPAPTDTASPGRRGAWTSTADIAAPVTDGTVIAGVTRNNNRVQAVDASTGRPLWDVPLPLAGVATPGGALGTAGPVLLAAPGAPLVVSLTATTPGSGLTPASTGPAATALEPSTGRTLWTAPGPANLLDGAAVLTGTTGVDTAGSSTTALDPATGKTRWTRPGQAVGLDGKVAVLSNTDAGISTVLTGTDTTTGRTLWSSADWARGAQGSRSTVVATGAAHALIETTRSDLAGDTTSLRVRNLRTGQAVGPEVPQPSNPTALTDPSERRERRVREGPGPHHDRPVRPGHAHRQDAVAAHPGAVRQGREGRRRARVGRRGRRVRRPRQPNRQTPHAGTAGLPPSRPARRAGQGRGHRPGRHAIPPLTSHAVAQVGRCAHTSPAPGPDGGAPPCRRRHDPPPTSASARARPRCQ